MMPHRITNVSALCLALVTAVAVVPDHARADGAPAARVLAAALRYGHALDGAAVRRACGAEVLCTAREIVDALGPPARLERVRTPDTDTIRWAKTAAALSGGGATAHGARLIALNGFGRTVESELRAALSRPRAGSLILDLRDNRGGDFGRMLRVAALLIGPRADALRLASGDESEAIELPAIPRSDRPRRWTVLIGPRTASSAEVLAALLRRHAGARLLGERTAGKDYLTRLIPVDQDWRLLIPAERIVVPGERLNGGLAPDAPLSAALGLAVTR